MILSNQDPRWRNEQKLFLRKKIKGNLIFSVPGLQLCSLRNFHIEKTVK